MPADKWGILGQLYPSGGSASPLYFCPPDRRAVVSTLIICNQSTQEATFRVAVVRSTESLDTSGKQYLYYGEPIRGSRSFAITLGITLDESDALWVYSSNGSTSFQLFGQESDN
jgi:hypothetical protein